METYPKLINLQQTKLQFDKAAKLFMLAFAYWSASYFLYSSKGFIPTTWYITRKGKQASEKWKVRAELQSSKEMVGGGEGVKLWDPPYPAHVVP